MFQGMATDPCKVCVVGSIPTGSTINYFSVTDIFFVDTDNRIAYASAHQRDTVSHKQDFKVNAMTTRFGKRDRREGEERGFTS